MKEAIRGEDIKDRGTVGGGWSPDILLHQTAFECTVVRYSPFGFLVYYCKVK